MSDLPAYKKEFSEDDTVNIRSSLITGMIGKVLSKIINKKFGVNVKLNIEKLDIVNIGSYENIKFNVNVSGSLPKGEIEKFL